MTTYALMKVMWVSCHSLPCRPQTPNTYLPFLCLHILLEAGIWPSIKMLVSDISNSGSAPSLSFLLICQDAENDDASSDWLSVNMGDLDEASSSSLCSTQFDCCRHLGRLTADGTPMYLPIICPLPLQLTFLNFLL